MFKALAGTPNLLKLHAGDAITGSLYYTFFKGKADAQMMNSICFDALVPGNHEFDDGDGVFKGFLDALADPANGGNCKTPTVSANRSFAEDASTGSWNSSCAGLSPLFSTTTQAFPSSTRAKA